MKTRVWVIGFAVSLAAVVSAQADLPITDGVALWLDATAITGLTNGSMMAVWPDRAPLGRDLSQTDANRQPTYMTNGINGMAAVDFDGAADRVFRAGIDLLAREIFVVAVADNPNGWRNLVSNGADGHNIRANAAQYRDVETNEFPYGGYFRQNNLYDKALVGGKVHIVHCASGSDRTYATFMVGDNGAHNRYWDGRIAEVIVYDRYLTDLERGQVGLYLEQKYSIDTAYESVGTVAASNIRSDRATLSGGYYASQGLQTGVTLFLGTSDGGTSVSDWAMTNWLGQVSGATWFSTNLVGLASDTTYYCRLYSSNAAETAWSPQTTVFRTRFGSLDGLSLWLAADSIVGLTNGGTVTTWLDASGSGRHAESQSVSNEVVYVTDGSNGKPLVRLNGSNDCYFAFQRLSNIRTVFMVAKEDDDATPGRFLLGDSGAYHFHRGSPTKRFYDVRWAQPAFAGETRVNGRRVEGLDTDVPTTLSVIAITTASDTAVSQLVRDRNIPERNWDGDIAELLLFDRVLTAEEQSQVGHYLATKYGIDTSYDRMEVLPASQVTMTSATLNGTLNDAGGQPTEVTLYWGPADGGTNAATWAQKHTYAAVSESTTFALPVSGLDVAGTYYYRLVGSNAVESFWAPRTGVFRTHFSSVTDGLLVWLDASAETEVTNGGALPVFTDWSGHGNDVRQADTNARPTYVVNVLNGMPVVHFDGVDDYMDGSFWLYAKTIIAVNRLETGAPVLSGLFSRRASDSQNIRSQGANWNSPATAINTADFPYHGRTFINGTVGYAHNNQYHVLEEMAAGAPYFPYRLSQPLILNNNHRNFKGDLAELLIYDRSLTIAERNEIGAYLAGKYGIAVAQQATPDVPVDNGLELWYAADAAVGYMDNQVVYQWDDLSGNGRHGANAGGATIRVPGVTNGLPVVRFDGTNNSYYTWARLDNIRSVFWVIREDTDARVNRFLLGSEGIGNIYHFHRNPGATKYMWNPNTHANVVGGVTRLNGEIVNGMQTRPPSGNLGIVSVVTAGNVTANSFSSDRWAAPQNVRPHRTWDGDLAELLIYSRPLSDEEEYAVGVYLTEKYALDTAYTAERPGTVLFVR